jgi:hypothetical protein
MTHRPSYILPFISCLLACLCLALTGCHQDETLTEQKEELPEPEPEPEPDPEPEPEPDPKPQAQFTDTVCYASAPKLTNYNFVYPSTDPFGEPVMLSGTISVGAEITREKPARGFLLYNHYTVNRADECPSRGMLDLQNLFGGNDFIIVSADYYGFGVTTDKPQAYCVADANAAASIDALTAARQLMAEAGYQWGDELLNVGYSQGGQTTMAVLKLATLQHPELKFTCTMAGAGPYDMPATYGHFLDTGETEMPSSIVGVLLAANEYYQLDIPYDRLFQEPLCSHVNGWILSKLYTSGSIDRLIGTTQLADYVQPELLQPEGTLSQRITEVLDRSNVCRGWTPRKDEKILLFHSKQDNTVPPVNTEHLYAFLMSAGVADVDLQFGYYGPHTMCGAFFAAAVKKKMVE